ncbi:MAG: 50S ribosomal protein L18 [Gemmatimonadota bacterium]|nr:50S ribosomal protein L18 [Gemmatimonadota bacterium]
MADKQIKKTKMHKRRQMRIRKRLMGTADRPRLTIFRSLKHIQAQLIDDVNGRSLMGISSNTPQLKDQLKTVEGKCGRSREVGKALAIRAQEAGISQVVFDRAGYLYHGRIKALAEGAREGGLKF